MKEFLTVVAISLLTINFSYSQEWYKMPEKTRTRWASFENPEAEKGAGGKENSGAKGHAFDRINAGESVTLLHVDGAGTINRIWLTINDRSPYMLRSLRIEMYWDGSQKPAVSAPLGDFFGIGLGRLVSFENELFSDPEGRSFNCYIPMPFKKGAKIIVTNDSDRDLTSLYYDVDLVKVENHDNNVLYFHTYWHRENPTELKKDYEILPELKGSGRFLGVNMGVLTNVAYEESWWGEGEVKMYLDGDGDFPTIVGTGTEDYIGTGWGQGVFNNRYQGSLIADGEKGEFAFYRYHVPDPVYFTRDIRVTIQQIGGWQKDKVVELLENGTDLIPVSVAGEKGFFKLLDGSSLKITDPNFPDGWVNFYRRDDVSSTAYFYLDSPANNLPELAPVDVRTAKMSKEN